MTTPADTPRHTAPARLLTGVAPALLLGLNLLVFGTFAAFSLNSAEFLVPYGEVFLAWYLPALAIFLALGLLYPLLGRAAGQYFYAIVFLLAIASYIHGNLLTWDTGILDGSRLDLSKTWRSVVDGLLWLCLAGLALRYRNWLVRHGWKLCGLLVVFQLAGIASVLLNRPANTSEDMFVFPGELASFSEDSNVIHVVLDAFQGSIFEELLAENPQLADALSGFTFFRDALTPSDVTYLAIPATLSGKQFRNDQKISAYQEQTLRGENLYSFLTAHQYAVDIATPLWWNQESPDFSSYYRVPTPYARRDEALASTAATLADLSLYRQAPHFLKNLVYRSGTWWLSSVLSDKPEQQFTHFSHNAFLADLGQRITVGSALPRYKFLHLVTPHAPLVANPDCTYSGAALEYNKPAFKAQSHCTLSNLLQFFRQLRERGIYDNTTLIVHGDHGGGVPFAMHNADGTLTDSEISLHHVWGNPLPLVLIKPAGAEGALSVSDTPVSLLDIPATVSGLLQLDNPFPGRSMFTGAGGESPERYFFRSNTHRNEAAAKDYFDEYFGYRVSGSVYATTSWTELDTIAAPVLDDEGSYVWNTQLSFGNTGTVRPFQDGGWIVTASRDVTWTEGHHTGLALSFPEVHTPVKMLATVKPLLAPGRLDQQRVRVHVGTVLLAELSISGDRFQELELLIPAALINPDGATKISFDLPDAVSPEALGTGRDRRELALAFSSLEFVPLPAEEQLTPPLVE